MKETMLEDLVRRLTVLGEAEDGGIIIGPQGWDQLQEYLGALSVVHAVAEQVYEAMVQ